jgi:hypothetical protein
MPLYMAFLTMGAIGPDKTGMKFSDRDGAQYRIAIHERNEREKNG